MAVAAIAAALEVVAIKNEVASVFLFLSILSVVFLHFLLMHEYYIQ